MNEGRMVIVDFCDDIRHEIGHKFSLMGCYAGNELISEDMPLVLPKLFASLIAITPIEKPFISLTIRAYLNDDLIADNEISALNLQDSYKAILTKSDGYTKLSTRVQMGFIPLMVQEDSILRIEAETEEGIIKGTKLVIRKKLESELSQSIT